MKSKMKTAAGMLFSCLLLIAEMVMVWLFVTIVADRTNLDPFVAWLLPLAFGVALFALAFGSPNN